jgi:hypothetical protein
MKRITPVACSLRVAASPLEGATPVARQSRFHGVSGLVHFARCGVVVGVLALTACGNTPQAPQWQMNAKGSAERATEAWLVGDGRVEMAEFARARAEVARTGRADWVARLELVRCATRVASLEFEPCTGFDALASDAAEAEKAYARYLNGAAAPGDAALLPEAHRSLVAANAVPDAALAAIQDPVSRLVAAGVLVRGGRATPGVVAQAVDTASARGWRRPLLAWLKVQQQRAQAAGDATAAAALQRRIDLVLAAGG